MEWRRGGLPAAPAREAKKRRTQKKVEAQKVRAQLEARLAHLRQRFCAELELHVGHLKERLVQELELKVERLRKKLIKELGIKMDHSKGQLGGKPKRWSFLRREHNCNSTEQQQQQKPQQKPQSTLELEVAVLGELCKSKYPDERHLLEVVEEDEDEESR